MWKNVWLQKFRKNLKIFVVGAFCLNLAKRPPHLWFLCFWYPSSRPKELLWGAHFVRFCQLWTAQTPTAYNPKVLQCGLENLSLPSRSVTVPLDPLVPAKWETCLRCVFVKCGKPTASTSRWDIRQDHKHPKRAATMLHSIAAQPSEAFPMEHADPANQQGSTPAAGWGRSESGAVPCLTFLGNEDPPANNGLKNQRQQTYNHQLLPNWSLIIVALLFCQLFHASVKLNTSAVRKSDRKISRGSRGVGVCTFWCQNLYEISGSAGPRQDRKF